MNSYIVVQSVGEGVPYKIKVLASDWHDMTQQNIDPKRTLGNTLSTTMGPSFMVYKGTAKVYSTDGAGYVTTAKLREWGGMKIVGGLWVAQNDPTLRQFLLTDHDGIGPMPVTLLSNIDPSYLNPTKEYVYFQFEFWQRA